MMSSILHLYAELLVNIRTVTLFASLETEHTEATKAELSADGETITLTHEGETASIRLPTQISGGGSATLTLPPTPSKDLTLRLQLKEKSPGLLKLTERTENAVPWSATSLGSCAHIACRQCSADLVSIADDSKNRGISRWIDLPNENWAEMMDFWHCHKPDEHHLPGHNHNAGQDKGYAAANKLIAKIGVGYVDLAYILVTESDCCGLQPKNTENSGSQQHQLVCRQCNATVGTVDKRAEGWRLWKWSMAVIPKERGETKTYSTPKWISAQLLALIENQGVRKFVIHSATPNDVDSIMIWVFTPDLSFSSSVNRETRTDPTRAMKVLWQHTPRQLRASGAVTGSQALDRQGLSVEELSLPNPAFDALMCALKESSQWLPTSARKFQEWNVGLLERFHAYEIA